MMAIRVQVSAGELLDKRSILSLKLRYINDKAKRRCCLKEYTLITNACLQQLSCFSPELQRLEEELYATNHKLWRVEDSLRECEHVQDFGPRFVELARSVYKYNDERAALKRAIDSLVGSPISEQKSYAPYQPATVEARPLLLPVEA